MSIFLADNVTSIELAADLRWSDEFSWQPVEQAAERTLTGALVVQAAAKDGGRPITLEPESDNSAWMTRAVIEQLQAWAAQPGKQLTLTLRGVPREVAFRHHEGAGLDARPVVHFADPDSTDYYLATLRLMEL